MHLFYNSENGELIPAFNIFLITQCDRGRDLHEINKNLASYFKQHHLKKPSYIYEGHNLKPKSRDTGEIIENALGINVIYRKAELMEIPGFPDMYGNIENLMDTVMERAEKTPVEQQTTSDIIVGSHNVVAAIIGWFLGMEPENAQQFSQLPDYKGKNTVIYRMTPFSLSAIEDCKERGLYHPKNIKVYNANNRILPKGGAVR